MYITTLSKVFSGAGTGGGQGGHWPPQYFADQLTLFELGRADYPHLLLMAPQCFSPSGITARFDFTGA